jgi:hypothetical protein
MDHVGQNPTYQKPNNRAGGPVYGLRRPEVVALRLETETGGRAGRDD